MKKLVLFATIFFACISNQVFAQSSEKIRAYIDSFKDVAIEEMQRTGVPASITLAQGIHETGAGTSDLVIRSNNHFGIKCKTEWTGPAVYHDDDARGECFRKYDDPLQSYRDHSDFLKNRSYYASLFKLDPLDYKAWSYGLKKAGYATNPRYPQILIKLIEDYNLQDYSLVAMNQKKPAEVEARYASNSTVVQNETAQLARVEKKDLKQLYPSTVFKINNTKVILVTRGTSFLKIANENDLSLSRLFDFNDMPEQEVAADDQLIYLQRKRKQGEKEFHIVEEGETVYDIAQSEGIRLEQLADFNFLRPGMQPKAGEKLYLQDKAPSLPQLETGKTSFVTAVVTQTVPIIGTDNIAPAETYVIHTVQTKETAYAISKKYGVTVEDLMKWNNLQSIDLKTGQQIRIKKATDVIR
jgi:LysM repeat protein